MQFRIDINQENLVLWSKSFLDQADAFEDFSHYYSLWQSCPAARKFDGSVGSFDWHSECAWQDLCGTCLVLVYCSLAWIHVLRMLCVLVPPACFTLPSCLVPIKWNGGVPKRILKCQGLRQISVEFTVNYYEFVDLASIFTRCLWEIGWCSAEFCMAGERMR